MIRVLHLIVSLDRGGAEHSLLELVSAKTPPDIEHSVCSIQPDGALLADFESVLAGRVHSLGVTSRADGLALARLVALLMRTRPTILHTWMFHANVLGRLAGSIVKVPVICGVRSSELGKPWWRIAADWATAGKAAHTIAVSHSTLEVAIHRDHVPPKRASVIPNGISIPAETAALRGLDTGTPVIGTVGRLETVKGHADLIEAFNRVAAVFPEARLEIVGRGPERARLARLAAQRGLAESVALKGEVPHARTVMADWDIYVQSSWSEGMPRAVMEAMAAGLPLVATNVGGTPEIVDSAGVLVRAHAPERIARAILAFLHDRGMAQQMATAARNRMVAEFSDKRFVERHLRLYRRIASGR